MTTAKTAIPQSALTVPWEMPMLAPIAKSASVSLVAVPARVRSGCPSGAAGAGCHHLLALGACALILGREDGRAVDTERGAQIGWQAVDGGSQRGLRRGDLGRAAAGLLLHRPGRVEHEPQLRRAPVRLCRVDDIHGPRQATASTQATMTTGRTCRRRCILGVRRSSVAGTESVGGGTCQPAARPAAVDQPADTGGLPASDARDSCQSVNSSVATAGRAIMRPPARGNGCWSPFSSQTA